jgi:hypothetical protein
VRVTAHMSFCQRYRAHRIPDFLARDPLIEIDLSFNDKVVDVDALMAHQGLALQSEFVAWDALQSGELVRVQALLGYLAESLAGAPWSAEAA